MRAPKTITPLFWRGVVFLGLFVAISGAIGPRIISGDLLTRGGFAVYGGLGKAMIFSLIAFALLVRHRRAAPVLRPWQPILLGWMAASLAAFALAWASVSQLLAGHHDWPTLALAHAGLLASVACAAIGCLGPSDLRRLARAYRREILAAIGLAAAFYLFLLVVYALWQPLASVVLLGVGWLLSVSGLHATLIPPNILMFDKFGITVAQYCSGIESIALFTGLYAIVGLLDWRRLNKRRYFAVFPLALLVLCLLNIVRVYGLIMAGYYINPVIAFSLFHTYAGMVFFILYSAAFWSVTYQHLLTKNASRSGSAPSKSSSKPNATNP